MEDEVKDEVKLPLFERQHQFSPDPDLIFQPQHPGCHVR
jgi:hypothetical protein